jgi:D-alanyl-D-alanine carboxypeptidase
MLAAEGDAVPAPQRIDRRVRLPLLLAAFALAAVAAFVGARALTGSNESPPTSRPALQAILDSLVSGTGRIAPGATAYVRGPQGTWTGSAGLADVERRIPMPVDARMRLESVSKIWTATLVLQLAQEGKLRLDDTVERLLPGLLPYGRRITIRQLLTHRSGIVDNNDIARAPARYIAAVRDPAARARLTLLAKRVEADPTTEFPSTVWIELAAWQPLLFAPGSAYHYSNIGFEVLGLVAARVSGEPVRELYRQRIFEPLRLEQSAYDPQGPIAGPHAHGYALAENRQPEDATDSHGGVGAEGGVVSDAADTATYLTALMHGQLLDAPMSAAMKRDAFWSGGDPTPCGGVAYGHSGGGAGFKTDVWVSGDGSRVAVLLLNGRSSDNGDLRAGAAMRELYCKG